MNAESSPTRTIAVVTGTRAEFGLLRPVMRAIDAHPKLSLQVIVTGTHLLRSMGTIDEVAEAFDIALTVEMQREEDGGRSSDAMALGRGIQGFAEAFEHLMPDVVVVLGDRIEAFAAASAASLMAIRVAHVHGGDRAEGIADDALRHAMTKLAHIHLPASQQSVERILQLGERRETVHLVGSPAIDGLDAITPLDDASFEQLGSPEIIWLLHPLGRSDMQEQSIAQPLLNSASHLGEVLALQPNHDPGHAGIRRAIASTGVRTLHHMQRQTFVRLLKRTRLLVGNSSSGLIECASLGAWCVNVGERQCGRERAANVIDVPESDVESFENAILQLRFLEPYEGRHPYGGGDAGARIAAVLATFEPELHPLRKLNTF